MNQVGNTGNYVQGQTIVLVDSYGSPTAASDLQHFHHTFFPDLPSPDFEQIFPDGNPQCSNTAHGSGLSGPNGAAGWSGRRRPPSSTDGRGDSGPTPCCRQRVRPPCVRRRSLHQAGRRQRPQPGRPCGRPLQTPRIGRFDYGDVAVQRLGK